MSKRNYVHRPPKQGTRTRKDAANEVALAFAEMDRQDAAIDKVCAEHLPKLIAKARARAFGTVLE
jgi:hypothetical protein